MGLILCVCFCVLYALPHVSTALQWLLWILFLFWSVQRIHANVTSNYIRYSVVGVSTECICCHLLLMLYNTIFTLMGFSPKLLTMCTRTSQSMRGTSKTKIGEQNKKVHEWKWKICQRHTHITTISWAFGSLLWVLLFPYLPVTSGWIQIVYLIEE